MQLCERLLLEYPERLNGKSEPLHRAILICLTASSSTVRRKCLISAKKIVGGLGGSILAGALLKDLLKFLELYKVQVFLLFISKYCLNMSLHINRIRMKMKTTHQLLFRRIF